MIRQVEPPSRFAGRNGYVLRAGRRPLHVAFATLAVTAVAVACRGSDGSRAGAALDGEITIGAGADNGPSGAFQARLGVYPLNVNIAEPLTQAGQDFELNPLLATRWESRGGNTWRFHLRHGVVFHHESSNPAENG